MPSRTQPSVRVRKAEPPGTIEPKWLLKAFGVVFAVSLLLGYATLCLLFYQGQWQIVLHPGTPRSSAPPEAAQTVRFGPDATATPQLTGWWVPAASNAPYRHLTLLYLRGGDGSLADDSAALATLHASGLNLLAFDYRGYPATAGRHPTQEHMSEDAEAAWQYLVAERHIAPGAILPYGLGVGASLATHLTVRHREIPAVVLDAPAGDLLDRALKSPQGFLLPVRLLFHERFPLAAALATLPTPKLILSRGDLEAPSSRHASVPKFTVELPPGALPAAFQSVLSRFLDLYAPPAPPFEVAPSSDTVEPSSRQPLK